MGEGFGAKSLYPSPIHRRPGIELPSPARGEGKCGLGSPPSFARDDTRHCEHIPHQSSCEAAVHGATCFSASRNSAVSVTPISPSVTIGTNIRSTWNVLAVRTIR